MNNSVHAPAVIISVLISSTKFKLNHMEILSLSFWSTQIAVTIPSSSLLCSPSLRCALCRYLHDITHFVFVPRSQPADARNKSGQQFERWTEDGGFMLMSIEIQFGSPSTRNKPFSNLTLCGAPYAMCARIMCLYRNKKASLSTGAVIICLMKVTWAENIIQTIWCVSMCVCAR